MPLYSFKCTVCSNIQEIHFNINDLKEANCCLEPMVRHIGNFKGQVAPQHQAAADKASYYGITNVVTGEGITDRTILRESAGIDLKG